MERSAYNGKNQENAKEKFDYKKFERHYIEGMKQHILADLSVKSRVKEYIVNNDLLTTQICCAFRNLTWFLTERDNAFRNEDDNMACKRFKELFSIHYNSLNLKKWKLSEADLSGANLNGANLNGAELSGANLNGADLSGAVLIGADLSEADLREANLIETNLSGADLSGADLRSAYLREEILTEANMLRVFLRVANLFGARYCLDENCKTIFPNGFNPKEHGMIEVDFLGKPVKKSETENNVEE